MPDTRPYQQSKAISVIAALTSMNANTTAVNEYRTFHGIRLISHRIRGSSSLIHTTPRNPQNTMYLPEVRPSIESHWPV